jgi:hypothetical protein
MVCSCRVWDVEQHYRLVIGEDDSAVYPRFLMFVGFVEDEVYGFKDCFRFRACGESVDDSFDGVVGDEGEESASVVLHEAI